MTPWYKIAIGLCGALGASAIYHGPMGHGAALIDAMQDQADAVIAATEVPGISVRMGRDPLSRTAYLSGPADRFQREGRGEYPGIDDRIAAIRGVARIEWTNPPVER